MAGAHPPTDGVAYRATPHHSPEPQRTTAHSPQRGGGDTPVTGGAEVAASGRTYIYIYILVRARHKTVALLSRAAVG